MKTVKLFSGCSGLNTVVDTYEYPYSPDSLPLASCSNVDVTDAKKIRRRYGTDLITAADLGSYTALFPGEYLYFVEGNALSARDPEGNITRMMMVTPNAPASFLSWQQGVFFVNGYETARIEGNVAYSWPAADNIGPDRDGTNAPVGHLVSEFGGHLVIAVEEFLFFSKPFDPFSFILDEYNLNVLSRPTMVREVQGGLWVSNQTGITFYAGSDPLDLDPIPRHGKQAVRGTDVLVDQHDVIGELPKAPAWMVTAEDAILLLSSDGSAYDLSSKKIDIPAGSFGTAMIYDGKYIVNLFT